MLGNLTIVINFAITQDDTGYRCCITHTLSVTPPTQKTNKNTPTHATHVFMGNQVCVRSYQGLVIRTHICLNTHIFRDQTAAVKQL